MRDEQEQSIKEKTSPPREDPRIDVLIGAYRNLAVKVDLLQEQIQEQEKELTRQDKTVSWTRFWRRRRGRESQRRRAMLPQLACERAHAGQAGGEAKNLWDRNRNRSTAPAQKPGRKKAGHGKSSESAVFYGLLLLLILDRPVCPHYQRRLASQLWQGYSGMIVLTESMQSEIPKGIAGHRQNRRPGHAADRGRHHLYGEPDHLCHPPDRGYYRELREHGAEGVPLPRAL